MSYCLNPQCPKPVNPPGSKVCQACGSSLLLRNRYLLVKGLGKGGFGATFLAADLSLPGKPLCVIKQLRPATDNPQFFSMAKELFEREAETLGKIGNHPQIPRLLDYFENSKQFYLIQEFVKGDNLQQEIKKQGPLSESKVRQVVQEISIILRDIHIQKVIHRDIKPANIIRREIDNKLVLIDFGVVKNQVNTVGSQKNTEQTTLTAFAVGTPGFAPPEQLAMRPVYASDIYALGITSIYLLTGKAPKNLDCDPITGEMNWRKYVSISDNFANILSKMLEVSVKHRYKTAEEVLKELDLESHLGSLSQGMVSKPTSDKSKETGGNRFDRADDMPASTAMSKLAMSIRANRDRKNPSMTTIFNSPKTQIQNANTTIHNKAKEGKKLDSSTLLNLYNQGRRNFNEKDLNLLTLEKADLSGANFNLSKMIKINLQEANLSGANLGGANLRQAILRKTNFGRAYLNEANLEDADLRGADLSFANLQNTNLKGANLCGANLTGANVTEAQIEEAKTNWMTILPKGKKGFW
ncbi:MAG: protein kinase domain-containing protein [Xenococcaceae cyanobacterium]